MNQSRIEAIKQYIEDVIKKYGDEEDLEIKIEIDNRKERLLLSHRTNRKIELEDLRRI